MEINYLNFLAKKTKKEDVKSTEKVPENKNAHDEKELTKSIYEIPKAKLWAAGGIATAVTLTTAAFALRNGYLLKNYKNALQESEQKFKNLLSSLEVEVSSERAKFIENKIKNAKLNYSITEPPLISDDANAVKYLYDYASVKTGTNNRANMVKLGIIDR